MLNPVFTDPNNALLKDRLARVSEQLRNLTLSTAEEYQAEVYSTVNAVLSLGYAMTPLRPVASEGPAVVGDAANNYTILNDDAQDIVNELLRIEDLAASLFNLAATSQNQLRQQIRESVYGCTGKRYIEDFLNAEKLASTTATIDYNAGLATNSLLDEIVLSPIVSSGSNSVGQLSDGSSFGNLLDGRPDTVMVWDGSSLELVLTFSKQAIVNRVTLNLDDYAGLEINTFTTSPDGTLVEDVLADLKLDRILIDGTSSKFSGNVIIDFPPRHIITAKIVIEDRVGSGRIALRELTATARRYSSTGQITTQPISTPTGPVLFTTKQNVFVPLTSITHQISNDGTQFTAITPDNVVVVTNSPFYYRAVLERSSSKFDPAQGLLVKTTLDPVASANYQLINTTTVPLGNGIIERTISANNVTGPIVLREIPMPNTLQVQEGALILSLLAGDYSFIGNAVGFPTSVTGITVTYQTSSLGQAALSDREEYYTPLLYEFKFEKDSTAVSLFGSAVSVLTALTHTVHLTWTASVDPSVTSYNVYRGIVSGGPYTRIATSVAGTTYDDVLTTPGTYYYVTTAVNVLGESTYSNEFVATIL